MDVGYSKWRQMLKMQLISHVLNADRTIVDVRPMLQLVTPICWRTHPTVAPQQVTTSLMNRVVLIQKPNECTITSRHTTTRKTAEFGARFYSVLLHARRNAPAVCGSLTRRQVAARTVWRCVGIVLGRVAVKYICIHHSCKQRSQYRRKYENKRKTRGTSSG